MFHIRLNINFDKLFSVHFTIFSAHLIFIVQDLCFYDYLPNKDAHEIMASRVKSLYCSIDYWL